MNTTAAKDDKVDYSQEGFKLRLVINHIPTYASVNQMMLPSKGELSFMDKYFIYLLHPTVGSMHFTMQLDPMKDKWICRDRDSRLDPEIIEKISNAIWSRKM